MNTLGNLLKQRLISRYETNKINPKSSSIEYVYKKLVLDSGIVVKNKHDYTIKKLCEVSTDFHADIIMIKMQIPFASNMLQYISMDDMVLGLLLFMDRYCKNELDSFNKNYKYRYTDKDSILSHIKIKQSMIPILVELDKGKIIDSVYSILDISDNYITYMILANKKSCNDILYKLILKENHYWALVILERYDILNKILELNTNLNQQFRLVAFEHIRNAMFKFNDNIKPIKENFDKCEKAISEFNKKQEDIKKKQNSIINRITLPKEIDYEASGHNEIENIKSKLNQFVNKVMQNGKIKR